MQHLSKPYKWISFFVILLVALGIAVPVLADYEEKSARFAVSMNTCTPSGE